MASCSKAPRGLFVLLWGGRIFTATSISPRPPSRQRPDRDTFRAGRNLPDKEFRYLRTVIVTAAVYRGFGSALARLPLTFRHWAGVSPHTSPRGLAETCACVKQSPGPLRCDPLPLHPPGASRYAGHPFSRSYGVNLPSSLTEVPSSTLVCSTSPPVSVCGTVISPLASGFSCSLRPATLGAAVAPPRTRPSVAAPRHFLRDAPYRLGRPACGRCCCRTRSSHRSNGSRWDGIDHPYAIAYGARPRLRTASPAAERPCCGTLGLSVWGVLAPNYATHTGIRTPGRSTVGHPTTSPPTGTLPYRVIRLADAPAASVPGLSPGGFSAPGHIDQ